MINGKTFDVEMPTNIPVINIAAANIPAVCACCGLTVCGAYIMANELITESKSIKIKSTIPKKKKNKLL